MRATPSVQVQPNVTPMIDVMLVLLIIFMVVTPAILEGFPVQLPRAENLKAHPEDQPDQTLGISAAGEYFLNKRPIGARELPGALRALYDNRRDDRVLYVKADRAVEYRKVLDALDVAAESGVRVVGMISEQRQFSSHRGQY